MSQSTTETVFSPPTKAEKTNEVQRQLERILEHTLFAHSRRYPALLRYVVEGALEGNTDHIKERSIGVVVFGRSPTYDTNADPIVRVTAGEIRKRLQQFYSEPNHAEDLRIVLPLGSYIPHFLNVPSHASVETPAEAQGDEKERKVQESLDGSQDEVRPTGTAVPLHHFFISIAGTFLVAFLSGWFGNRVHHSDPSSNGLLRQFWSSTQAPLLLCLPDVSEIIPLSDKPFVRTTGATVMTIKDHFGGHQSVARADMLTATRVVRSVGLTGRAVHIRLDSETNLDDLCETPVVLIGAFDNQWSIRALQQTPFRFKLDLASHIASIVDTRTSSTVQWSRDINIPNLEISRDYAIVARFADSTTGQLTIVLAGIGDNGTEAAGELVSSESGLSTVSKWLHQNPRTANFEIVLSTDVVAGRSGPPAIVAATTW